MLFDNMVAVSLDDVPVAGMADMASDPIQIKTDHLPLLHFLFDGRTVGSWGTAGQPGSLGGKWVWIGCVNCESLLDQVLLMI